jgi:hypothetical protein
MKYFKLFTLPLLFLITVSCLDSNVVSEEKRLSIYFQVDGLGHTMTFGEQELTISEFKFALDRISLHAEDAVLQTGGNITALIFAYTDQMNQPRLIIDVGLGFSDVDVFNGYEIFLEPVASRTNIQDTDFFGDDENYSVIIKGGLDDEEFVFRSSLEFETFYDIGRVELTDRNETLLIISELEIESLFTNDEGEFLNPLLSESESQIIDNIRTNLEVSATASSIF